MFEDFLAALIYAFFWFFYIFCNSLVLQSIYRKLE